MAAQRTGLTQLPVIVLDHLTERQARALRIADNRIAENGGWDEAILQAELAARCRALIRRANLAPSGMVRLGRLSIDLNGRQLQIDSQPIELTRREWLLLESLAHNLGRIVTKERLMQALSGWEQDLTPNAVETHISRLRSKLAGAAVIRTVRGLGYRLDEPSEPPQ